MASEKIADKQSMYSLFLMRTTPFPLSGFRMAYFSRRVFSILKFMNHWETTECNCFTSQKDPTPKPYKSSIVYKFVCPGCNASYIGKTDRCLYTRVNEHAKSDKSEIYNHVHDCEHFEHVLSLLNLPCNLLDVKYTINIVDLIFDNCYIIDRSNNWSLHRQL